MRKIYFRKKRAARSEGGWTLWETLVVLAIIGILALVAVPSLVTILKQAKTKATQMEMGNIVAALHLYMAGEGNYPETLDALVSADYFQGDAALSDEWNTAYSYRRRGDDFDLVSAGADKQFGTADDLTAR